MSKNSELLKKVAHLCSSPFFVAMDFSADSTSLAKSKDSAKSANFSLDKFLNTLKDFEQESRPIIIAGLGNPTAKYAQNRHNIGFMIVDKIAQILELEWENATKFNAQIATLKGKNIHLLKPQAFMNLSGEPLKHALNFYKIKDFVILHDELDIDFGYIRYKIGGSSGGHNGLKSIDENLGNNYMRLRFGIGRGFDTKSSADSAKSSADFAPQNHPNKELKNHQVISYVLGDFDDAQAKRLDDLVLHSALSVLYFLITRDFAKTQNLFTLNPAKSSKSHKANATHDKPKMQDKSTPQSQRGEICHA